MMRKFVVAALSCFVLASGCGPTATPVTPAPTAPARTRVTAAYSNIAATVLPLWTAKETGVFDKHGLDVDLQYVASATAVPAVISGQMQMAEVGGSEVLGAIAGGADLVIVAIDTPTYPYVFEAAPGIQSPADLKGKAVGISRIGSSSDIATRVVLKSFGLDADKDVNLVQTGSVSDRAAAMQSGAIQAARRHPTRLSSSEWGGARSSIWPRWGCRR
jgi:NitT/TauT family transport system substrate-binding protein